jgi:hypothetical protein
MTSQTVHTSGARVRMHKTRNFLRIGSVTPWTVKCFSDKKLRFPEEIHEGVQVRNADARLGSKYGRLPRQ